MNRKKTRRDSKSAAVYVPAAAVVIVLLLIFGTNAFLKVMRVEVEGASRYTDEEIIEAAEISLGRNLMFIDLSAASKRIAGAMPYISGVKMTRMLPDAIRIEITESTALAFIDFHDDILIIDSAGRVLERTDAIPRGLLEIRGFIPVDPEAGSIMKTELGDEMRLRYLTDVLAALEKSEARADVLYIDVASIGNITVGYTERFRVVLGSSNNALHKLDQLPWIVDKINKDNAPDETGVINMSDPTGEWRFNPD